MASTIPTTMQAWTHTSRGPPSKVLHLTDGVPIRRPKKPNEVLVKVSYAALNPGGSIMLHFVPFIFRHSPAIPEMDFSGTIVEIGPSESSSAGDPERTETDALLDRLDNRGLIVGAEVFGSVLIPEHVGGGHGALAEYVLVDYSCLVKKPANCSLVEASGLGITGCTALVLVERAKLQKGDRVLVNGASGGIGTLVIQMVKEIVGKEGLVVGVCSERNSGSVKELGADEVAAYDTHMPVTEYLEERYGDQKFDVVIDALGIQEIWHYCDCYLKESGLFVTVGVALSEYTLFNIFEIAYLMILKNTVLPVWLGGVPRKYVRVTALVTLERLQKLGDLVTDGKLKVIVDSVWDMVDVQKAYKIQLARRARGKIVVKIEDS